PRLCSVVPEADRASREEVRRIDATLRMGVPSATALLLHAILSCPGQTYLPTPAGQTFRSRPLRTIRALRCDLHARHRAIDRGCCTPASYPAISRPPGPK